MDYQQSVVNIEEGNRAVDLIKDHVKSTHNSQVLNNLGSFAGFYELPEGYNQPVLVSCTDGVGTKLKLAIDSEIVDTVGIDLVAMCVNDLICCGAKPLHFLDYIACHQLIPEQMERIIQGMVEGCKQAQCALIGGEMAEMNDMYQPGDFDLAGFAVGVVEKTEIIDGSRIQPGDHIYAMPSSGVHSNGYSLVRKIIDQDSTNQLSIDELLTPTRIYVQDVLALIEQYSVHGIAHVTGGGLVENVERVLPNHCHLDIQFDRIKTPSIFKTLQNVGQITDSEMWKVFNMGVGMIIISPDVLDESKSLYKIGQVISK